MYNTKFLQIERARTWYVKFRYGVLN